MNILEKQTSQTLLPPEREAPSCCRRCAISCCLFPIWDNQAPPLCEKEVARIISFTGRTDFFNREEARCTLKAKANGFCHFFDETKRICRIYAARPFDCRIFPFDFFAVTREEGWWLIWDCPFFQQLDSRSTEAILTFFESTYAEEIIETWDYGNQQYTHALMEAWNEGDGPRPFRFLRRIEVTPAFPIQSPIR